MPKEEEGEKIDPNSEMNIFRDYLILVVFDFIFQTLSHNSRVKKNKL